MQENNENAPMIDPVSTPTNVTIVDKTVVEENSEKSPPFEIGAVYHLGDKAFRVRKVTQKDAVLRYVGPASKNPQRASGVPTKNVKNSAA